MAEHLTPDQEVLGSTPRGYMLAVVAAALVLLLLLLWMGGGALVNLIEEY